jgi:hypothetical protein
MTRQPFDVKKFRDVHIGGWALLWSIYKKNKPPHKSIFFWLSVGASLVALTTSILVEKDPYQTAKYLADKIIDIMPDILGFNLGAYVLLIGLNSQSILDKITIPQRNSDFSLFQKMSSVFAISILVQSIALTYGYSILTIMEIGGKIQIDYVLAQIVNGLAFTGLAFFSFYSMLLIPVIIFNIFQFGQMLHYKVSIERVVREREEQKSLRKSKTLFKKQFKKR